MPGVGHGVAYLVVGIRLFGIGARNLEPEGYGEPFRLLNNYTEILKSRTSSMGANGTATNGEGEYLR